MPVDAGTYAVAVESNSPNYDATATGSLVISPAAAAVVVTDLAAKYDGSSHEVTVAVTPDVAYSVSYDGGADAPVNAAGDYAVVVTVTDGNYSGSKRLHLRYPRQSFRNCERFDARCGWNG